jgi:hypothetical protein
MISSPAPSSPCGSSNPRSTWWLDVVTGAKRKLDSVVDRSRRKQVIASSPSSVAGSKSFTEAPVDLNTRNGFRITSLADRPSRASTNGPFKEEELVRQGKVANKQWEESVPSRDVATRKREDLIVNRTTLRLDECMQRLRLQHSPAPPKMIRRRDASAVLCLSPSTIVVNGLLTVADLQTLPGTAWLNDAVINYYLELMIKGKEGGFFCHSSHFLPKLARQGPQSVARWTRGHDLKTKKLVLIPAHVGGNHWCLAVAEILPRRLWYFDSLGSSGSQQLKLLRDYFAEMVGLRGLTVSSHARIPRQQNGHDCGMFALMFARDLVEHFCQRPFGSVQGAGFSCSQRRMPELRRDVLQTILDSHDVLLHGPWPENGALISQEVEAAEDDSSDLIMLPSFP